MLTDFLAFFPYWLKLIFAVVSLIAVGGVALDFAVGRLDAYKKLLALEDEYKQKQLACELQERHTELVDTIQARRSERVLIGEAVD